MGAAPLLAGERPTGGASSSAPATGDPAGSPCLYRPVERLGPAGRAGFASRAGRGPNPPYFADLQVEGSFARLTLRDDGSGVDWESLRLTGGQGQPLPLEKPDPASGEVRARVSDGEYRLAVRDLSGNETTLPFSVSPLP